MKRATSDAAYFISIVQHLVQPVWAKPLRSALFQCVRLGARGEIKQIQVIRRTHFASPEKSICGASEHRAVPLGCSHQ